jgi:hypothetical protein
MLQAILLGAILVLTSDVAADAATVPCSAAKLAAVADAARGIAACTPADAACLAGPSDRLAAAFARADAAGGCADTLDASAAFDALETFVGGIAAAFPPSTDPGAARCAAHQLRAATRDFAQKVRCHVRALRAGTVVDAGCLARADARLASAFAAAQRRGRCATNGDPAAIGADVDGEVSFFVDTILSLPTCLDGPAPECGGTCPAGGVCGPDLANFANTCRCILPTQPCGDTYPVCNGTCPAGATCGPLSGGFGGACGCVPDGTVPCADAAFPVCGGGCPPGGEICAPVNSQVGAFFRYVGCACGGAAPCGAGGIACPPGETCTILAAPGINLTYCASPAGAFLD